MRWSDIQFSPAKHVLRQFAGLWLLVVGTLGLWHFFYRDASVLGSVLMALAVVLGVPGLVWPALIRPVFVTSMVLTFPIGWVVSTLLLALLYFFMFTPLGLVFRLFGRDALRLRREPTCDSYWTSKPARNDPESYFWQF